jgi:hypothetical protein
MTKAEWISTIKHTLMKIDETGIYREPLLEKHIQSVYEQMYNELYRRDKTAMSKHTTLVTELVATSVDLSSGRTLPKIPVSLPRRSGGVFEFYIGTTSFVLTSFEGYRAVTKTWFDTAGFKGHYVAALQHDKIYANTSTGDAALLTYRMIPKFTSLNSTDEVMIPEGHEEMFIDRIIDTVRHMQPTDLINDNAIQ